ncbi:NUDIX hydrolase [Nitrosovibrio sp. Nv17]|jgi:ADP-ribose pyrophosphatase YjhB (NUDIX family)|uniref:NUDIX hydrolase n=1 Tax=Nitrosovibrio sp. Nv17 TaxID=1855339 RepID=UPI000908D481|nr:NUDIX hydrolase [Nitrosovibrio sp. Nv17]SFW29629.1 ADP-ribose pyrophosphatase YjhB, NUDIX family [Nitrosovibrio sp. Nv17]
MKFCSNCGGLVEWRIPEGDALPRYICPSCHTIHYQNPKIVVGCIPEWEDRILLCRRAIEPRHGLWTVPSGFMENAETLVQGAARETLEEANARVEMGNLYAIYNIPHINQVHVLFRARLLDLDFSPGSESLDVRLFAETEIPWTELAFRVIHEPLRRYFEERQCGRLGFHMGTIEEIRG